MDENWTRSAGVLSLLAERLLASGARIARLLFPFKVGQKAYVNLLPKRLKRLSTGWM